MLVFPCTVAISLVFADYLEMKSLLIQSSCNRLVSVTNALYTRQCYRFNRVYFTKIKIHLCDSFYWILSLFSFLHFITKISLVLGFVMMHV